MHLRALTKLLMCDFLETFSFPAKTKLSHGKILKPIIELITKKKIIKCRFRINYECIIHVYVCVCTSLGNQIKIAKQLTREN